MSNPHTITVQDHNDPHDINDLLLRIATWHYDRNLVDGSTDEAQFVKLQEEVEELNTNIGKNNPTGITDDIGDIIVVLVNIAERNNLSIYECLTQAYNDIKDRKGKMINGVFVKESDLKEPAYKLLG